MPEVTAFSDYEPTVEGAIAAAVRRLRHELADLAVEHDEWACWSMDVHHRIGSGHKASISLSDQEPNAYAWDGDQALAAIVDDTVSPEDFAEHCRWHEIRWVMTRDEPIEPGYGFTLALRRAAAEMSRDGLQATLEESAFAGVIRQHGPDHLILPYRVRIRFGEQYNPDLYEAEDVTLEIEGPEGLVAMLDEGNMEDMNALWHRNTRSMLRMCTRLNREAISPCGAPPSR